MAKTLPVFSDIPVPLTDEEIRGRLYLAVSAHVIAVVQGKDTTGLQVSRELGRAALDGITEILFRTAIQHGYVRFPSGHGSLKVQRLKRDPQPKRLPTGALVTLPPNRVRLRYEEGAAVREALGMPPKTSYKRQYRRTSVLNEKTQRILDTGKATR